MTDLTDDQVKALVAHFPRPQQHRSGEPLLDMVYADPGNSGFYYREEKPDSVTCYVRIDHVARALLDARAERDRLAAELAAAKQREAELRGALEYYADTFCEGFCKDLPQAGTYQPEMDLDCSGCKARAALTEGSAP